MNEFEESFREHLNRAKPDETNPDGVQDREGSAAFMRAFRESTEPVDWNSGVSEGFADGQPPPDEIDEVGNDIREIDITDRFIG